MKSTMKKLLGILFAVAVLVGVLTVAVSAETLNPAGDPLTYTIISPTAVRVTGYAGGQTAVTIPAAVQGYSVIQIEEGMFNNDSTLQTLSFANGCGISTIRNCFNHCVNLSSISWGSNCGIGEITESFVGCVSLRSLTIPASVRVIGESSFSNCISLSSLRFDYGTQLTAIRADAFAYTGKDATTVPATIISLRLPASLTTLEEGAFHGIPVRYFSLADGSKLQAIPNGFLSADGDEGKPGVNTERRKITLWIESALKFFDLKSPFDYTPSQVAEACASLVSIDLGNYNALTQIGDGAFKNQIHLTNIDFGENSLSAGLCIGHNAFAAAGNNGYLTDQGIDTDVEDAGLYADLEEQDVYADEDQEVLEDRFPYFRMRPGIRTLTLPANLVTLRDSAFKYARIRNLVFQNGCKLKTIPDCFLWVDGADGNPNTDALTVASCSLETIDFGDNNSLEIIRNYAFRNQSRLTRIDFGTSTAAGLIIGDGAFLGAGNNGYYVKQGIDSELKGIDTVVFPANLTDFGDAKSKGTYDYSSGQTAFRLARVKHIVFADNCKLSEIPDCFMRIESNDGKPYTGAEYVGANALETIDFGENNSLKAIYNWAFYSQSHLTGIDFGTSQVDLYIANGAFGGAGNNAYYVEQGVDSELNEGIDTLVFPANLKAFDDNRYEFRCDGQMAFRFARIKNIVFADGCRLQKIPNCFMMIEGEKGQPFTSVEYVGANALETIDFGDNNSLQQIDNWSFKNQSHLTKIDFGSSEVDLYISDGVFVGAGNNAYYVEKGIDSKLNEGIDTLVFPKNLKEFGDPNAPGKWCAQLAFRNARIKNLAFEDNCRLQVLPSCFLLVEGENAKPGVTTSESPTKSVFYAACALETIDFGDNNSLICIDLSAFKNQCHLKEIDFGTSEVEKFYIYDGAFLGAGNNAYLVAQGVDRRLNAGIETLNFPSNLAGFGNKDAWLSDRQIGNTCFRYARVKNIIFPDNCMVKEIPDNFMRVEGVDASPYTEPENYGSCALETIDFGENNSLEKIYNYAFRNQSYLTKIDFGSSTVDLYICDGAFLGAGNNAYYVEQGIDSTLNNGIETLVFPKNLKAFTQGSSISVDTYPFRYSRIHNLVFEDGCKLETIPRHFLRVEGEEGNPGALTANDKVSVSKAVLYASASLETVDFGDNNSLSTIEQYAFRNQSHLTKIDFGTSTADITFSYGVFIGAGNNAYLVEQGVDRSLNDGIDTLVFPKNLTSMDNHCFRYARIKNIVFPDNCKLTSIGSCFMEIGGEDGHPSTDTANAGSNYLKSVDFGENTRLTQIGGASFHNQSNLTKIDFGSQQVGITLTLACGTFAGTSPETLTLPANIVFDGNGQFKKAKVTHLVFADNFKLTTLPDGFLTKDFNDPFDQPTLETIDFGTNNSLTTIGAGMFAGNRNLKTLDLTGTKITTIEHGAFNSCGLTKITLPATVTTVNEGAFQGLNGTKTLTIGSEFKVTKLEGGVFSESRTVTTIDLYDSGITTIGDALKNNPNLERIVFPKNLESIRWGSAPGSLEPAGAPDVTECPFYGCSKLSQLYFGRTDPSGYSFDAGVFQFVSDSCTFYVPAETSDVNIQAYKTMLANCGVDPANCDVERFVPVTGITLNHAKYEMTVNSVLPFYANYEPADASCQVVRWASSNPNVAKVDEDGNVTALFPGKTVISATSLNRGKIAYCDLEVAYDPSIGQTISTSTTTYTVTAAAAKNGTVAVSTKKAASGTTVAVTVTPDAGYTLETINVTTAAGNAVALTAVQEGKSYTFKMPASNVTVTATFMEDNSMLNFFVDVKAADYYYDAVLWAAENGITSGVDSLHFAPGAATTRGQMVTFLWRAAGSPEPTSTTCSFTDVKVGAYYYKAVLWAVEKGITTGKSASTFAPDAVVTRAQAVTFLWRYAGAAPSGAAKQSFTDVLTGDYFFDAVYWAQSNGITTGKTATTFAPNESCTRGQIVTFLYRSFVS